MMKALVTLLVLSTPAMADKAHDAIERKDGASKALLYDDAVRVNIRPSMRAKYGVLHPKAKGKCYRTQAGWCAATVQKHWDRYTKAGGKASDTNAFLVSLAKRYCPIGAGNDPSGLNKHWLKNVSNFHKKFK